MVRNDDDGKSAEGLWIDGGLRIEFEAGPARTLAAPVEVGVKDAALVFLARLSVEDYTAQVVQGETSGNMPAEALKAMAVVARTYAAHFRGRHQREHFDFCDSTHCQFASQALSPAVLRATQQTRGQMLWEGGHPIAAYYHQDCGGKIEAAKTVWPDARERWSRRFNDPYCVRAAKSWRAEVSLHDLHAALAASGLRAPIGWNGMRVTQRTPSGRVQTLSLFGAAVQPVVLLSASSLRFAVGRSMGWGLLKSDLYDLATEGDHFVFVGRGTGHGVGLCQLGAIEMAREGRSYREILEFYYPGSSLSVKAGGIAWRTTSTPALEVSFVGRKNSAVVDAATRALRWSEQQTRLQPQDRPRLFIYPTVEMFRDDTGEPGWVAASTLSTTVRLQPLGKLGPKLEDVLRHEFVHLLLESRAAPGTPLWFREGLAMHICGEEASAPPLRELSQAEDALKNRSDARAMQAAYSTALSAIDRMQQQYGRNELLRWLSEGIPPRALDFGDRAQQAAHDR